jgi:hypothetical protein
MPAHSACLSGASQPMLQCEAMWINFAGSGRCALKVIVGGQFDSVTVSSRSRLTTIAGVNALSGRKYDAAVPVDEQDYMSLPLQPWLGQQGSCELK